MTICRVTQLVLVKIKLVLALGDHLLPDVDQAKLHAMISAVATTQQVRIP